MPESLTAINGIEQPKIIEKIKNFFVSEVKPDEMEIMPLSQSEFELDNVKNILNFNPFKDPVEIVENDKFIKKRFSTGQSGIYYEEYFNVKDKKIDHRQIVKLGDDLRKQFLKRTINSSLAS